MVALTRQVDVNVTDPRRADMEYEERTESQEGEAGEPSDVEAHRKKVNEPAEPSDLEANRKKVNEPAESSDVEAHQKRKA
jgi:hypothetical protein